VRLLSAAIWRVADPGASKIGGSSLAFNRGVISTARSMIMWCTTDARGGIAGTRSGVRHSLVGRGPASTGRYRCVTGRLNRGDRVGRGAPGHAFDQQAGVELVIGALRAAGRAGCGPFGTLAGVGRRVAPRPVTWTGSTHRPSGVSVIACRRQPLKQIRWVAAGCRCSRLRLVRSTRTVAREAGAVAQAAVPRPLGPPAGLILRRRSVTSQGRPGLGTPTTASRMDSRAASSQHRHLVRLQPSHGWCSVAGCGTTWSADRLHKRAACTAKAGPLHGRRISGTGTNGTCTPDWFLLRRPAIRTARTDRRHNDGGGALGNA
jgi:hypothetical protein